MLISIKTLSGRKLSLDFEGSQKIIEIKETLQEKEGIPKEQIRLIYSGKVLNDEMKIEEYSARKRTYDGTPLKRRILNIN